MRSSINKCDIVPLVHALKHYLHQYTKTIFLKCFVKGMENKVSLCIRVKIYLKFSRYILCNYNICFKFCNYNIFRHDYNLR